MRQAAKMLTGTWWSVNTSTIVNCWQKAGLSSASLAATESPQEYPAEDDDIDCAIWQELSEKLGLYESAAFEDCVSADSQVDTCAELRDEDIIASMLPNQDEDGEEPPEEDAPKVSGNEALQCLEKLKAFAAQQSAVPEKVHECLNTLTQFTLGAILHSQKQQKIMSFFSTC